MSPELPIALLAGVVLGASAHRAGLCTVKAVAEVATTGRAHILWSFLKASLWTTGILALAALFGAAVDLGQRPILASGIAGGLIFGLGAAVNGACSFSTLSRLADGHLVMLFTVLGWGIGIVLFQHVTSGIHLPAVAGSIPVALTLPLFLWMLWEVRNIWRRRDASLAGATEGYWSLSISVLLIAVANSALLLADRPWSFTSTALCSIGAFPIAPCQHTGMLWTISLTAMLAMLGSSMMRGSFHIRRPRAKAALRHLVAGLAMGLGAGLIPGGNDGLILFGLPALSPHALPSWAACVVGIAVALSAMRVLGVRIPKISCEGDICRSLP